MTNYDTTEGITEREQRALTFIHKKEAEKREAELEKAKRVERRWAWLRHVITFIALFAFVCAVISSFNN